MKKKDIMKHISGLTIEFGSVDPILTLCEVLKTTTECVTIELWDAQTNTLDKHLTLEKKLLIAIVKNDLNEYLNNRRAA